MNRLTRLWKGDSSRRDSRNEDSSRRDSSGSFFLCGVCPWGEISESTIYSPPSSLDAPMPIFPPPVPFALEMVEYADTQIYIPNISSGKVVKVYDGDTLTIANRISIGDQYSSEVYRFHVRLNGIDTPEIKSKNPHTKMLAIRARDAVSRLLGGKIVQLRNVSLEKYGRLLADVYLDDLHINEWMIHQGYATRYTGGAKQIPAEWETPVPGAGPGPEPEPET